jgi:hypothetical protein
MIDAAAMTAIRDELAARRAGGDFTPYSMDMELMPRTVRVDAVSQDGEQVFVRYDDGATETLKRSEIKSLTKG